MTYHLEAILATLAQAGQEIMRIYTTSFEVKLKDDRSPLTLADEASHRLVTNFLYEHTPHIPIISEEDDLPTFEVRKKWKKFWLLDPLDGTKEFIDRNGDFTINLALIKEHAPVLGIVYVPAQRLVYWAEKGKGAFKRNIITEKISVRKNIAPQDLVAAVSRSHMAAEDEEMLKKYGIKKSMAIGSSLKFCLLAEGKADFYYRYNPTMEWDTAAGQILVEEAGGVMLDKEGKVFSYNKNSLLNGSFLCKSF